MKISPIYERFSPKGENKHGQEVIIMQAYPLVGRASGLTYVDSGRPGKPARTPLVFPRVEDDNWLRWTNLHRSGQRLLTK